MDYYAYTNPSYSDDEDDESEEEYDYYPVVRSAYLESIVEETSDDFTSSESSCWDQSTDDAVSVIRNEKDAKRSQCQVPGEETSKGEQLDKWLEESISLGSHDPISEEKVVEKSKDKNFQSRWNDALDLHMKSPCEFVTPASGDGFNSSEGDEFEDGYNSEGHVECFNGFVKCCHARSLSDLMQISNFNVGDKSGHRPCNDNLSEDSGFCDANHGENEKTIAIGVITEENNEIISIRKFNPGIDKHKMSETIFQTRVDELWQEEMLEKEWERSLESGRAATDDWLGLKIKAENSESPKKSCSLPSLVSVVECKLDLSTFPSFNDHSSAPASLLVPEDSLNACQGEVGVMETFVMQTRDQESMLKEGSRILSASSDSRHMQGLKHTAPNWEKRAWVATPHLASSPQLETEVEQVANTTSATSWSESSLLKEVLLKETCEKMSRLPFARTGSIPKGGYGIGSYRQTPAKTRVQNGQSDVEKVHVVIVNGKEKIERPLLHVKFAVDDTKTIDFVTLQPSNNVQQVQNVHIKDDNDDTASRALEDSYHHMERAITYFQQEIKDKNSVYLHDTREPPINSSRTHIWNARQQYFDQSQPPKPDIGEIFNEFRKRAKEGRDRAACNAIDLNNIERSVRDEINEMKYVKPTVPAVSHSSPKRPRRTAVNRGVLLQASKQRSLSTGYLETDIDTLSSRQVFEETHFDDRKEKCSLPNDITGCNNYIQPKALSMLSLRQPNEEDDNDPERARSMEYLLDVENKAVAQPPENQLMRGEKTLSEHELRIQRSLKQLNIPEWFANSIHSNKGKFSLRKKKCNNTDKWPGLTARAVSASSMDNGNISPTCSTTSSANAVTRINTPYCWRYPNRWSKESLHSPRTPSPMQEKEEDFVQAPSPTGSLSKPATTFFVRQPYLGWRSSERLSQAKTNAETAPLDTSSNFYRSAAERLSAGPGYYSLRYANYPLKPSNKENIVPAETKYKLPHLPKPYVQPKQSNSSIPIQKPEVRRQYEYNANHGYVKLNQDKTQNYLRSKAVWMESSFVGVKPNNNETIKKDGKWDLSRNTVQVHDSYGLKQNNK